MDQPPSGPTSITTFILRFWREPSSGSVRWRGRVEHVQSGHKLDFLDAEGLLRFLRARGLPMTVAQGVDSEREIGDRRQDS
jgi:hypothetical protein